MLFEFSKVVKFFFYFWKRKEKWKKNWLRLRKQVGSPITHFSMPGAQVAPHNPCTPDKKRQIWKARLLKSRQCYNIRQLRSLREFWPNGWNKTCSFWRYRKRVRLDWDQRKQQQWITSCARMSAWVCVCACTCVCLYGCECLCVHTHSKVHHALTFFVVFHQFKKKILSLSRIFFFFCFLHSCTVFTFRDFISDSGFPISNSKKIT